MAEFPEALKYAATHEWARLDEDGLVTVGISDHAQDALGDLVFIELPEVGAEAEAGKELAVVESVKAASDVYAPVSGVVAAINEALADAPETVNASPYGDGWFFKLKPSDAAEAELNALLPAADYAAQCQAESA